MLGQRWGMAAVVCDRRRAHANRREKYANGFASTTLTGRKLIANMLDHPSIKRLLVMMGATLLHIRRGELTSALTTAVLLVLVTFVAYVCWKVTPILPRTVPK